MMLNKPFSPACERNKEPILKVLREIITEHDRNVLEIGSGSGQHAVYFASHFPNLIWFTSDREKNHSGIKQWISESDNSNIEGPISFEIGKDKFPQGDFDLVFTANTFHIMSWKCCKTLMKLLGKNLKEGSQFLVYGPFNYCGEYTSDSNKSFDQMLKERDLKSGIRSFEDVHKAMEKNGFSLYKDYEMPANNRLLVFTKINKVTK